MKLLILSACEDESHFVSWNLNLILDKLANYKK